MHCLCVRRGPATATVFVSRVCVSTLYLALSTRQLACYRCSRVQINWRRCALLSGIAFWTCVRLLASVGRYDERWNALGHLSQLQTAARLTRNPVAFFPCTVVAGNACGRLRTLQCLRNPWLLAFASLTYLRISGTFPPLSGGVLSWLRSASRVHCTSRLRLPTPGPQTGHKLAHLLAALVFAPLLRAHIQPRPLALFAVSIGPHTPSPNPISPGLVAIARSLPTSLPSVLAPL